MRVLVLHNRYQFSGGEDTAVAQETGMLQERGHEVDLLLEDNDDVHGIGPQIQAAVNSIYSRKSYEIVRRRIAGKKPDVVHVHNFFPKFTPSVYTACRDAGVPVVQTLHNFRIICPGTLLYRDGHVCQDCVGRRIAWPGALHGCYRQSRVGTAVVAAGIGVHHLCGTWKKIVSQYIALTEFSRGQFIAGGLPEEKITVKPNSADDPGTGSHEGKFLLFAGRLTPEKGVRVLVEAATRNLLPLPLKILGTGPLSQEVANLGAARKVEWLEQCPRAEVIRLMKDAACLVFPSLWFEGMPMVIVEAFATGLPVVASNLGSMSQMIKHEHTGLLFEPENTQAMADCVSRLLADAALHSRIQRNARAEYLEQFDPEANTRCLLQIYERAIHTN
jgi:glycosyltransferase involved in cell wall biosynthesis